MILIGLASGLGWWRVGRFDVAVVIACARGLALMLASVPWFFAVFETSLCVGGDCSAENRAVVAATIAFGVVFVGSVLWSAAAVARHGRAR